MDLSPAAAARIIRRLAVDDASVFFTRHAERRMFERHVSVPEVLSVLRRGRIVEGPARGARWHWRCSLAHALRERELTVAVALGWDAERSRQIIVITVFGDR
ncbi:DUF4258 domain-containing protein [Silanimonas sp.]|uniref:DUF4258 domain-containing protein n=1 Tax=Silanimonas sp. TaxID=1929290 RepID=UPI001BC12BD0|nr:DUF4258 domain-containing protein [Silanimonas sp.]MBS3896759.1 DUF4258 domain-containing protein [Silanimonas sp.]MBS3924651.1 DUF4258 domain-containing protein [Xanthomonadaceae bacterium]MBS3924969.1 DUF4258 domain-containing protein [Xanthomonadaceae bacterium]